VIKMKKTAWIVAGLAISLPVVGLADVLVTADAPNSGYAVMFELGGGEVARTYFNSGYAEIATAGLSQTTKYGVSVVYDENDSTAWNSSIYWDDVGLDYWRYVGIGSAANNAVTALAGKITNREYTSSSVSVTLSANGPIGRFDNEDNAMDAALGFYRPGSGLGELGSVSATKLWDSAGLSGVPGNFGYTTAALGGDFSTITLTKDGDFYADYLASSIDDNANPLAAGVYNLQFVDLVSGIAFDDGSIVSNGNDVVFTVDGTIGTLGDLTPYYVMLDQAWMYDDAGNSTTIDEYGLSLTNPDYYAIPEPAAIILLLGAGGGLLAVRRFFLI
jgi:hypothetical protein